MISNKLKAGVGKVDITPPVGIDLSGYIARTGPSSDIHDKLYAKVLLLNDTKTEVAIITSDLLGINIDLVEKIRNLAEKKTGIIKENIIISASHTHSGPAIFFLRDCGEIDNDYLNALPKLIVDAILIAKNNMKESLVGAGSGKVEINVNRFDPEGPKDSEVGVVKFEDTNKNLIACIVNYTCHPTSLKGDTLPFISADYPGVIMSLIETVYPGAIALFTNGACGNITAKKPEFKGDFNAMQKLGLALGGEVLKILQMIKVTPELNLNLKSKNILLPLNIPKTTSVKKELQQLKINKNNQSKTRQKQLNVLVKWCETVIPLLQKKEYKKNIEIEIKTLTINNMALVFIPAELFVELGLEIKNKSNMQYCFIVGYANGNIGYIPTIQAYRKSGYEVDSAYKYYGTFPIKIGSGELIKDTAIKLLKETIKLKKKL
ncbi:MAG: neutral/alkaline non-lysosomal ceramidase N-terminal domain-containing protein [Elusimicrobia bacterium]|nr:neutral/alkaline non-lysosomal ceramidase N-terminal domain-containing protein [Elusimicrobiota bacterium]